MNRRTVAVASLVVALGAALMLPGVLTAKGRPVSEASNNLSAPTIFVGGGTFTGVACGTGEASALVPPSGTPRTGYELAGSWWVQGVHRWQAQCLATGAAAAAAAWGDNLGGDAKLRVGKPIRVELGLEAANPDGLQGYVVEKLEPSKLDRESAYGTVAVLEDSTWVGVPDSYDSLRVYDGAATFSIRRVGTDDYVVQPGTPAKGEINATGKVVYGYQLKVTVRGQYEITYRLPNVTITGVDIGTYGADTVTLVVTVI